MFIRRLALQLWYPNPSHTTIQCQYSPNCPFQLQTPTQNVHRQLQHLQADSRREKLITVRCSQSFLILFVCSDNLPAPTTQIILDGLTPSQFHPALISKRHKSKIVLAEKLKTHTSGTGLGGTTHSSPISMMLTKSDLL
jgi:hypothetical protein